VQTGAWEYLLCAPCEKLLNEFDDYFARTWLEGNALPCQIPREPFLVRGLDYARFKLFHLSVLWRAHVASRSEFAAVQLGRHGEFIRKRLLARDPGPEDKYPIAAACVVDEDGSWNRGLMIPYALVRQDGHHSYLAVFAGSQWIVNVSSHPWGVLQRGALTEAGTLLVLVHPLSDLRQMLLPFVGTNTQTEEPSA
jgi:hypothetical protein